MKYFVFHCSNGFCGCDEDFYKEVEENQDLKNLAEDILDCEYTYNDPDPGFLDIYEDDEEAYQEACEEYVENLSIWYEEISRKEYEESTYNKR